MIQREGSNTTLYPWSQNLQMLRRLWVNSSTNITLVIKSALFLPTLLIPMIFDLIPSTNFTTPPSLGLRFLNQDLFLFICLEQPLSKYNFFSFSRCDLRHTCIKNNLHFKYPYLFGSFWVSCLFETLHTVTINKLIKYFKRTLEAK